jgi:hypothetical protein
MVSSTRCRATRLSFWVAIPSYLIDLALLASLITFADMLRDQLTGAPPPAREATA